MSPRSSGDRNLPASGEHRHPSCRLIANVGYVHCARCTEFPSACSGVDDTALSALTYLPAVVRYCTLGAHPKVPIAPHRSTTLIGPKALTSGATAIYAAYSSKNSIACAEQYGVLY